MNEQDKEPPPDDFEVEVSDIHDDDPDPTDDPDAFYAGTPLSFQARLSPRARAWRISLVASAFLVLLVFLLGSFPDVRTKVVGVVQGWLPTTTPALPPNADRFYIETDIPWTSVSLDGRPLSLPRIGLDPPLQLTPGQHVLAWTASPFRAQQCLISVPPNANATCPVLDAVRQSRDGPAALLIALHESLDTLPLDQQQTLLWMTQSALNGYSDIVQPGESYFPIDGNGPATQPIRATLHMQLQTEDAGSHSCWSLPGSLDCQVEGVDCARFCTVPWEYRQEQNGVPDSLEWLTFGVIHSTWEYASLDGRIIAQGQPIDLGEAALVDQPVLLRIAWDGLAWHVQPLFGPDQGLPIYMNDVQVADDPGCLAAEDVFAQAALNYSAIRFVSGANPAAGCLVEATDTTLPGTPAPSVMPIEYYLVRFGEVLSVNDLAHQRQPYYSSVTVYEQNLARQLAALPGGLIDSR